MNRVELDGAPKRRGHGHALGAAALLALAILAGALFAAGCIEKEKVECAGGTAIGDKCFPPCEASGRNDRTSGATSTPPDWARVTSRVQQCLVLRRSPPGIACHHAMR